ncbi:MAG: RsmB/NOP family class I SAM-dependent RNA methyltransferase [Candidatus Tectomicrobia bacterium]|nr:RsmB/NOP family class I SAM-dependent RNA methyltransferase [Candidatus Tectomicrobia bacterium]
MFERYRSIIPDYEGFLEALRTPAPKDVRINTLKIDPERFSSWMVCRGYSFSPNRWYPFMVTLNDVPSPGSTLEYFLGYYHPQGFASALPSLVLDPQPGERILDLCAAPGGKTSHIAQLMENRGFIVANDFETRRLRALQSNLERLGVLNVVTTHYQGQNFPMKMKFHRVLVDAPCSGEGRFRVGEGRWQGSNLSFIMKLSQIQKQLILKGFDLLLPGGTLVYATCTFAPEENEEVVAHLLKERDAELAEVSLPVPHTSGVIEWEGKKLEGELKKSWRLYPHQTHSWGFFLAKCLKRG